MLLKAESFKVKAGVGNVYLHFQTLRLLQQVKPQNMTHFKADHLVVGGLVRPCFEIGVVMLVV